MGLERVSDGGTLRILAVDHRDSLRAMHEDAPAGAIVDFKRALVSAVRDGVSGVMLDPEYGIGPGRASEVAKVGFIAALEAQGYLADPSVDSTTVLTGWGVAAARQAGAAGIKLLVLHDALAGGVSPRQADVIRRVVADAAAHGLPLFVEPLPVAELRLDAYLITVRQLAELGAGVLKLQAPVITSDDTALASACAAIHEAAGRPWALLSAGVAFDVFCHQLEVAVAAGCSGYIAGRAVWGPVPLGPLAETLRLIADVVLPRLGVLNDLVSGR